MRLTTLLVIFVLLLTGCSKTAPQEPKPEITSKTAESEEGYHDLVFLITQHQKLADGSQLISASGTHKGKSVGFDIVLGSSWKEGSIDLGNSSLPTYQGELILRSVGAESDLLLQIMDQLYDTKLTPSKMRRETIFTAISLQGNPQQLENGMTKLKLFYETQNEDDEVQLFANIDLAVNRLYLDEKDTDYRSAVVRALKSP